MKYFNSGLGHTAVIVEGPVNKLAFGRYPVGNLRPGCPKLLCEDEQGLLFALLCSRKGRRNSHHLKVVEFFEMPSAGRPGWQDTRTLERVYVRV